MRAGAVISTTLAAVVAGVPGRSLDREGRSKVNQFVFDAPPGSQSPRGEVAVGTERHRPESLDREATSDRIIGRREELQALAHFIDAVPAGGYALLLEGEAGIGKTALWQEGMAAARRSGVGVLAARAGQAETGIAFAAVGDMFASS